MPMAVRSDGVVLAMVSRSSKPESIKLFMYLSALISLRQLWRLFSTLVSILGDEEEEVADDMDAFEIVFFEIVDEDEDDDEEADDVDEAEEGENSFVFELLAWFSAEKLSKLVEV